MKHDKTDRREDVLDLDKYQDRDDLDFRNDELGEASRRTEEQQPLRLGEEGRNGRNGTIEDHNGNGRFEEEEAGKKESNAPVAWRDLPRRQQLIIITLARLSEPLVQTSLQAYLFYQLKSFDPSLPDSSISNQAGIMHASFMAAQFVTAMIWGRVADSPLAGRKTVLLIGLLGTSLSCIGFGFSKNFWQALVFRTVGGMTNGNVGVMRTMISEIIREKKYQSRAFLLLPMTFNIGIIVGPVLGGVLSDPAGSYPSLFGDVPFFENFPYATPNIVSAIFLFCAAVAVWLGLEETLDSIRDSGHIDLGSRIGHKLAALLRRRREDGHDYSALPTAANIDDEDVLELPETPTTPNPSNKTLHAPHAKRFTQRLPFRRIFTRNLIFTFLNHFLIAFHAGTFNSLWFVFLSTPVYDPEKSDGSSAAAGLPFRFTGGLGLQPRSVGIAMAVLGAIGITMQLTLYPRISGRLGTIRSWRYFLCCFPIAYFLVPYLAVVPSTTPPPDSKTGPAVWAALFVILFVQVLGRTFALPAQHILVNNCSPHPSVLGTVHGLGQSASSGARTIGPMIGGFVYGVGLNAGYVGLVWWILSGIAICNVLASLLVREGDGHEIWLEGDKEE